jgi:hypothetical protein
MYQTRSEHVVGNVDRLGVDPTCYSGEVDSIDHDHSKPEEDSSFTKDLTVSNIADSFAIAFAFALVIKVVMYFANYLGFHPQNSGGEEF